jgi:two-component system copper resistance phosphate regulon response regulator CusR
MRILVIEGQCELAESIRQTLVEHGYAVDLAVDGVEGRRFAIDGDYGLILIDVVLSGIDGFGVLAAVRQGKDTPVLMLGPQNMLEDRVRALEEGADDYLVKPFAFAELLARIHALLRRGIGATSLESDPGVMTLGDLKVDLTRRKAFRAGRQLFLSPREFALLTVLLHRRGEVLSREVLIEEVWDKSFRTRANVVDVAVRRLRAKLDSPFPTHLLHTVRGTGYVLEVREVRKNGR